MNDIPGVDLVTGEAVVVMQDRSVIGLSSWMLDQAIAAERQGLVLQLVTPPSARMTYALRSKLFGRGDVQWVIDPGSEHGPYDALTGECLRWDGRRFSPIRPGKPQISPDWLVKPSTIQRNLQLVVRVRYPAVDSAVVGGATELLFRELTGAPPAGWGSEEPISQPWDLGSLTDFCGRWAPRPVMLAVAGSTSSAAGSIEVVNRPAGLEETVTMAVAVPALDASSHYPMVRSLAERFELVSLVILEAGAAADSCTLPRFSGLPIPVALALGQEARSSLGADAEKAIAAGAATSIGDGTGLWFPVGTGDAIGDWKTFAHLIRRLTIATGNHSSAVSGLWA